MLLNLILKNITLCLSLPSLSKLCYNEQIIQNNMPASWVRLASGLGFLLSFTALLPKHFFYLIYHHSSVRWAQASRLPDILQLWFDYIVDVIQHYLFIYVPVLSLQWALLTFVLLGVETRMFHYFLQMHREIQETSSSQHVCCKIRITQSTTTEMCCM